MLAEPFDGRGQLVNAAIFWGHGANDGRVPAIARHDEREHGVKLLFETIGAFTVSFVQNKDIADLHEPGFHVLDIIAETRNEHDQDAFGLADDVDLVLSDEDSFDEYLALHCRV